MKRTITRGTAIAAAALTAIALAACSEDDSGDGTTTVKVATLKGQPHLYHPYFYSDHAPGGVTFEIVLMDSSPDIKNAVVSGTVDFGIAGVPSAVSAASAKQDIVVVAAAADGGTGFIAREGITGFGDLVGRKVGYPKGASQEILLRLTLEREGIDLDSDVELVNLPFADMAGALESGRIDAFSSAEIGPSVALQKGAVSFGSPYETAVGKVNIGLYATGATAKDKPELVQQVVDTHIKATEFMAANPDKWAASVVETFGLDAAVTETAIKNIWPRWTIDAEYTAQVRALIEQMAALKQIESTPDVAVVLDPMFVTASTAANDS